HHDRWHHPHGRRHHDRGRHDNGRWHHDGGRHDHGGRHDDRGRRDGLPPCGGLAANRRRDQQDRSRNASHKTPSPVNDPGSYSIQRLVARHWPPGSSGTSSFANDYSLPFHGGPAAQALRGDL